MTLNLILSTLCFTFSTNLMEKSPLFLCFTTVCKTRTPQNFTKDDFKNQYTRLLLDVEDLVNNINNTRARNNNNNKKKDSNNTKSNDTSKDKDKKSDDNKQKYKNAPPKSTSI